MLLRESDSDTRLGVVATGTVSFLTSGVAVKDVGVDAAGAIAAGDGGALAGRAGGSSRLLQMLTLRRPPKYRNYDDYYV
jgi:hypothetical protein